MSDRRFSGAEIAKAIGMTPDNFRAHLSRKGWRIIGGGSADSGSRQFTVHDALGYALARVLMFHGLDTKTAFERAMLDFAQCAGTGRDLGDVFDVREFGRTFYVYSLGAEIGRCVAQSEITDPIELLLPPMHLKAEAAILIDLWALRARVLTALGVDPTADQRRRDSQGEPHSPDSSNLEAADGAGARVG